MEETGRNLHGLNKDSSENRRKFSDLEYFTPESHQSSMGSSSSDEIFSDVSNHSSFSKYVEIYNTACCLNLSDELWPIVYEKDTTLHHERGLSMFSKNSCLKPIHRVILLDWIMEVCDLYNASRDTYYFAVDFIDRFLTISVGIQRGKLQLIGITCLLMASKMEEVKPIPIVDLIFLSDGLYNEDEVLEMERQIFETIGWRCYGWTANKWLFVYLHVQKKKLHSKQFCQLTNLLDLAILDVGSLQFSYSVLAASCLFLVLSFSQKLPITSNTLYLNICECTSWMEKFWLILQKKNFLNRKDEFDTSHTCKLFNNTVKLVYDDVLELYHEVNNEDEEYASQSF